MTQWVNTALPNAWFIEARSLPACGGATRAAADISRGRRGRKRLVAPANDAKRIAREKRSPLISDLPRPTSQVLAPAPIIG